MVEVLYDASGVIGAIMIVGAYLLLQTDRLSSRSMNFSVTNALGASLILVSLVHDFNLGAFVVEAFWLAVSLYGIGRAMSRADETSPS